MTIEGRTIMVHSLDLWESREREERIKNLEKGKKDIKNKKGRKT